MKTCRHDFFDLFFFFFFFLQCTMSGFNDLHLRSIHWIQLKYSSHTQRSAKITPSGSHQHPSGQHWLHPVRSHWHYGRRWQRAAQHFPGLITIRAPGLPSGRRQTHIHNLCSSASACHISQIHYPSYISL